MKTILILCIPFFLLADIGKLSKIVDGDTLYFNNAKCRIAYIDTHESRKNLKAKRDVGRCSTLTVDTTIKMGKAATKHAKSLVKIGKSYQYDVVGTDRYERSICVVKLGTSTYNEQMVRDGFALPFEKYIPHHLKKHYLKLSSEAKSKNRGLWKERGFDCVGK
jgi:endonuclease YncB( thermonuclease family)